MKTLIYLLRHGEIDKPSPRSFLGQTDLPLNENGMRQARALREKLKNIRFSAVFSSPLQRAVQTAALVGGIGPEAVLRIEEFKEINLGTWEGLTVDEIRKRYPGAYEQRGENFEFFRPEGKGAESFADLACRCYPALLALTKNHSGPLLVVAHAGVNRVLLSRLQKLPLQKLLEIPQEYCAVNILRGSLENLQVEAVNV